MSINAQDKGKTGEREIVTTLLGLIELEIQANQWDEETARLLRAAPQRNQNQSAVGGGDINIFGLSLEIKRQEQLALNTWWNQCVASAQRNHDIPILIYRQNHKPWLVVMKGSLWYSGYGHIDARVTVDFDTFKVWFRHRVVSIVKQGDLMRV